MGDSVGQISLEMTLDKKPLEKTMKEAEKSAAATGERIASSFKKVGVAIAGAFSAAAIVKFGKDSIESAAKVQASNSQLEQTFGNLQEQARAAMKKIADESGILQTRLQGVGTGIYAFAKTAGMDSAEALGMMQEALQVTADSAAYYDRSLEDTAESLKSFLKGNYANDAALGISCTETTRNAAANRLYGKSFKDLSEAQKQLTLLQMVKDANALSGAVGQAARESNGWENVLGNLKESWNQLLAVVGKPILQGAVKVIQGVTAAIQTLSEYARAATAALSDLFNWGDTDAAPMASIAADSVQTAAAIGESADNQEELTKETKKTSEAAKNGVASFDKLNVITQNKSNSDTSGSASGGSAGAIKAQSTVQKSAGGMADSFKQVFANLYEESGFKDFVDNLQEGINKVDWGAIAHNFRSVLGDLKPIAETAFGEMQKVGKSAFGALGSALGAFITVGGKSVQTASGGIAKWLSKDKGKIQDFIKTIGDNFSRGFDNISRFFGKLGDVAGGSIDRMRPRMETSISNLLSGLTDFAGGVGEVVSGAFETATQSLAEWVENDGTVIGEWFDSLQTMAADTYDTLGMLFGGIGTVISDWWNGDAGQTVFQAVCDMFLNIGTTLMNVWNQWVMPIWNAAVGIVQSAWNKFLQPVFSKLLSYFSALGGAITTVWNNYLSPLVNFIVNILHPAFVTVFDGIKATFKAVFSTIGGIVSTFLGSLANLTTFLTNVFQGNWEGAWQSISDFFTTIWNGLQVIIAAPVNFIIDGLNSLIDGLNCISFDIPDWVPFLGGKHFGFDIAHIPNIPVPELATGGLVTAPTLAVVGDNPGARSGDPEVVSPLSKLQGMIAQSGGEDVVVLTKIYELMKRMYEMFIVLKGTVDRRSAVRSPDFAALFDALVAQNEIYKDTHDGVSAFA